MEKKIEALISKYRGRLDVNNVYTDKNKGSENYSEYLLESRLCELFIQDLKELLKNT